MYPGPRKLAKNEVYGEFENKQKKDKKNFDLPKRGFEPQIFSNFPAHDLNFHGR